MILIYNIDEDEMSKEAIQSIKEKIFKTRTGINYINHLYIDFFLLMKDFQFYSLFLL